MRPHRSPLLTFASLVALTVGIANSAAAADPTLDLSSDPKDTQDFDPSTIATVTVTSQRRVENAQNVPVSVHTLSAADLLQNDEIKNVNDVATAIPSASAGDSGTNQPRWFVRGLGTNRTDFNTVSDVGIYFDDVYIANTYAQEAPLFDLKRVEADLGPQGTLWGKNANGGAINYISNTPTFAPDGYVRAGYGSFAHQQEEAAYGGPLVDEKLAFRIALYNDDNDGWQKNLIAHTREGGRDAVAGRIEALYTPSADLDVLVNFHASRIVGTDTGANVVPDPNLSILTGSFAKFYPGGITATKYGDIVSDGTTKYRDTIFGGNVKVNDRLGDLTLTSISGAESFAQWAGSPGAIVAYPATSPVASFDTAGLGSTDNSEYELSEELRLANPGSARWTWQTGLFGYYEHIHQNALTDTPYQLVNKSGSEVIGSTAANTGLEWGQTLIDQSKKTFAAFANSTYSLTDSLRIEAGVRWSDEALQYAQTIYGLGDTAANNASILAQGWQNVSNGALLSSNNDKASFQSWIYEVKPQFKVSDTVNTYASFSHAVEPGSYTSGVSLTGTTAPATFGPTGTAYTYNNPWLLSPETLEAYEVGAKSQWLGNKLVANVAVYDYEISGAFANVSVVEQSTTSSSGTVTGVVFRNAGNGRARGADLSVEAVPLPNWHIGSSLGLLTTKFTSQASPTYALLDTQFPRSPKVTLNGSSSYDEALPWGGTLRWAADARWQSGQWFYPSTCYQLGTGCTSGNKGPDLTYAWEGQYVVANAHLIWYPRDDKKWSFQADVLNATDTHYQTHHIETSFGGAVNYIYAPPLSVFFGVGYKF